jgi:uncharacterized protein
MDLRRREFLKAGLVTAGAVALGPAAWQRVFAAPATPGPGPYGPLLPPNKNGLMLPAGFTSRVVARSGLPVGTIPYVWPIWPDGAHCFGVPGGGWIQVVNSETPVGADLPVPPDPLQRLGGASAIRYDSSGKIVDAYAVCTGTRTNCSGGHTPWGTWLTCEEFDESIRGGPTANAGQVWECDPTGAADAVVRPALGSFKHEAAAVDAATSQVYLTEDVSDGRLYRFTPASFTGGPADLAAGTLAAAKLVGPAGGPWNVTWLTIPDPAAATTSTRSQVPSTTPFDGGEGCWFDSGVVYFTTKGDNRVWRYHVDAQTIDILYDDSDPQNQPNPVLRGVDDVLVSRSGDIYIAEDGDNMQINVITPANQLAPVIRATGVLHGFVDNPLPSPLGSIPLKSEVSGLAFSPDGTRLYFNSQRGEVLGISYEVRGPFRTTA